jgi:hypothetical protein
VNGEKSDVNGEKSDVNGEKSDGVLLVDQQLALET